MPSPSEERLCPICDSPLQPGSRKCSFCGTDLSIFDLEIEPPKEAPTPSPAPPKVSAEARVDEIFSKPVEAPKLHSPAPSPPPVKVQPEAEPVVRAEAETVPEPGKAPEAAEAPGPETPAPAAPEPKQTFECPACKSQIPISATVCPKCGVMFAEEGAEMFQCPACNTLVKADAKTCPGCGAMFVEPEEAVPSAPAVQETPAEAAEPAKKDIEAPVEAVEERKAAEPEAEEAEKAEKKWTGWFRWGKKKEPKAEPKPSGEVVREVTRAEEKQVPSKAAPSEAAPAAARPSPASAPARPSAAAGPSGPDKGEQLAFMVTEWKPLFALASEKGVDTANSKQLIDDAIAAGRERQIDRAIELVKKSKAILSEKVNANLGEFLVKLNEEMSIARDFGGDVSRAATYMQEVARARESGDFEAAYVYADKVEKELLPITGRYNEAKVRISNLKTLIRDCEVFIVDTRDARRILADASRAFDLKDFDKVESLVKGANESLYKAIPARMTEELKKAKDDLVDAKARNANITPMLTVLKSATKLMKAGEYAQALKEMRQFRDMMKEIA